MNETEKKVVARAANGLALMALGLRNGDFMSATDIASALDDRVEQLRCLLKATSERRGEESPAESAEPESPETPKKHGLVGERCNDTAAIAWSLTNGLEVLCQARKVKDGVWSLEGRTHGMLHISATVFGGKCRTVRYMKFIRNGMVSRAMRHRRGISRAESQGRREAEGK